MSYISEQPLNRTPLPTRLVVHADVCCTAGRPALRGRHHKDHRTLHLRMVFKFIFSSRLACNISSLCRLLLGDVLLERLRGQVSRHDGYQGDNYLPDRLRLPRSLSSDSLHDLSLLSENLICFCFYERTCAAMRQMLDIASGGARHPPMGCYSRRQMTSHHRFALHEEESEALYPRQGSRGCFR